MRDSLPPHSYGVSGIDHTTQDHALHRASHVTSIWRKYRGHLTLLGLGALAVSQALLSDLQAGAGDFVARRIQPMDIVALVVVVTLVPGLVANLLVGLAGVISKRLRSLTEAAIVMKLSKQH